MPIYNIGYGFDEVSLPELLMNVTSFPDGFKLSITFPSPESIFNFQTIGLVPKEELIGHIRGYMKRAKVGRPYLGEWRTEEEPEEKTEE